MRGSPSVRLRGSDIFRYAESSIRRLLPMKRVFVTGAPGWLGNRLVRGLSEGIADVPGLPVAEQIQCLVLPGMDTTELRAFPRVALVAGDVTKPETLRGVLAGCDTVIHAVGLIHPKRIRDLYLVNTEGVRNVLGEAIRSGVRRMVLVSSNSPAGINRSRNLPFTEESPYHPYLHYGRSKMLAEEIMREARDAGRIESVIIRPCWFYGPGQPQRQSEFFRMIQSGRPPLFGTGMNLRSMSYIDHVVQGCVLAATVDCAAGQTYWIADAQPYTTLEIYETIAGLLEVPKLRPIRIPSIGAAACRVADTLFQACGIYHQKLHVAGEMDRDIACTVERAQRELGYRPLVTLREGMQRSLDWCRTQGREIPAR